MKFEIKTKVAKEYLKKVSSLVPNFSALPSESGVLISVHETRVVFKSKNEYIAIKLENNDLTEVKIIEEGSILVKGKMLYEIVSKMSGDMVSFIQVDKNILIVKSDDSEYEINLLNSEEYEEFAIAYASTEGVELRVKSEEFKHGLQSVAIAVPEKHQRKVLQGINIKNTDGKTVLIGTDGVRIHKANLSGAASAEFNHTINIRTVKELLKVLSDTEEIRIKFTESEIIIEEKKMLINARLLDGVYPDVQKPFDIEYTNNLVIRKEVILDMLDRSTILSSNKLSETAILKMIIVNGMLRLESREIEIGYANTKTDRFTFDSDNPFAVSFNPRFLSEAIKTLDSKRIRMQFLNPNMPILVTAKDSKQIETIVLPFKTN